MRCDLFRVTATRIEKQDKSASSHTFLGGSSQSAPVRVAAGRDHGTYVHLRDQATGGGHPPEGGQQGVVADEGGGRADGPAVQAVAEPYGLHRDARVQGRLEDGPPEGAPRAPAPGAPLGEHTDRGAGAQRVREVGDGAREGAQPVAFEEDHPGPRGQRPGDRPPPYLRLGDQPGGAYGGQQRDVQPGDVVGDQQHPARRGGAPAHPDPHARGPHHRQRPAAHQPGRDAPAQRQQRDPGEQHHRHGRQPQHGPRRHRAPPRGLDARPRGAGRAGQPDAHQTDGTRERKCRR